MCKLMLNVNFKEGKQSANLFKVNKELFEGEKDGTVVFSWKGLKNPERISFDSVDKALDYIIKQSKNKGVFGMHTRTATSGVIAENNLHFWIQDGYSFAHNGWIAQLSGISQVDSDSKLFFDMILRRFEKKANNLSLEHKVKIISNLMRETGFSGVAFFLDTKKKQIYLLGTREIDVYSDMKTFISFASFSAVTGSKKVVDYAGFGFEVDGIQLPVVHNVLPEGIYVYDISKKGLVYQAKNPVQSNWFRPFYDYRTEKLLPSVDENKDTTAETSEEYLKRIGYLDD